MAKFDIKNLLNFGKKKGRSTIDGEYDDELEDDEFDDDLDDMEDNIENENTSKSSKKFSKKQIIIGGVVITVIAIGAATPYILPSLMAPSQEEVVNLKPTPMPKPIRPHRQHKVQKTTNHKKSEVKITRSTPKNIGTSSSTMKLDNNKKNITTPIITKKPNIEKHVKDIETSDSKIIKQIEHELVNDKLSGKNDILALTDDKVVQARSFNDYLDQKLSNMDKLITFYKKKKELEDILNLYKTGYQNEGNKNSEMDKKVESLVSNLETQIRSLKHEINQLKTKEEEIKNNANQNNDRGSQAFENMASSFQNLNIYTKDGRYIAVLQSNSGDRIIREGDLFNGYKVVKISDDMITFEKDGKRYYYSYAPSLDEEYEIAKIPLPVSVKDDISRTNKNRIKRVKEYKPIDKREMAQRTVTEKLRTLKRTVR